MEYRQNTSEWVDAKLANLASTWEPNPQQARARLAAREGSVGLAPRRLRLAAAFAGCALCILVVIPGTRAVAQRIWDKLFLGHVTVLRVNTEALPWELSVQAAPDKVSEVDTPSSAAERAGFIPLLPPIVPMNLAVIGAVRADVKLSTLQLQQALQIAGVMDIVVPSDWDGVRIGIDVSPMIVANYPGDITLMQLQPIGVTAPAGFAMHDFAEIAFRIVGLNSTDARRMASQFTANPSWFLGVPRDEAADIREVDLRSGKGIVIEDRDEDTKSLTTALVWSITDRTFLLSGKIGAERAIAIANDTPSH
jgi:hypothetical protein